MSIFFFFLISVSVSGRDHHNSTIFSTVLNFDAKRISFYSTQIRLPYKMLKWKNRKSCALSTTILSFFQHKANSTQIQFLYKILKLKNENIRSKILNFSVSSLPNDAIHFSFQLLPPQNERVKDYFILRKFDIKIKK